MIDDLFSKGRKSHTVISKQNVNLLSQKESLWSFYYIWGFCFDCGFFLRFKSAGVREHINVTWSQFNTKGSFAVCKYESCFHFSPAFSLKLLLKSLYQNTVRFVRCCNVRDQREEHCQTFIFFKTPTAQDNQSLVFQKTLWVFLYEQEVTWEVYGTYIVTASLQSGTQSR